MIKYLIRGYKNRGLQGLFQRFSTTLLLPSFTLFFLLQFSKWYTQQENWDYQWDHSVENNLDSCRQLFALDGKQRGIHLLGFRNIEDVQLDRILKNNIEYLVLVPYLYQEQHNKSDINLDFIKENHSWSKRDSSIIRTTQLARAKGMEVLIKPHIWLSVSGNGKWRSDIAMSNEEAWQEWEDNYSKAILHYARLSEFLELPVFCLGTELHTVVKDRSHFWEVLIPQIRGIYQGQLTYAANWNQEFMEVSFWNMLNFIGIQAYFPLTKEKAASIEELERGWQPHVQGLSALARQYQKPILFTEIGYKSTPGSAIRPWEWEGALGGFYKKISTQTQANCYEAFFRVFWNKSWFAGSYFWQWQAGKKTGDGRNIRFSPQNKPAENILAKWFGRVGGKVE